MNERPYNVADANTLGVVRERHDALRQRDFKGANGMEPFDHHTEDCWSSRGTCTLKQSWISWPMTAEEEKTTVCFRSRLPEGCQVDTHLPPHQWEMRGAGSANQREEPFKEALRSRSPCGLTLPPCPPPSLDLFLYPLKIALFYKTSQDLRKYSPIYFCRWCSHSLTFFLTYLCTFLNSFYTEQ